MRFALILTVFWCALGVAKDEVANPMSPKSGKHIELSLVKTLTSEDAELFLDLTTNADFALTPRGELAILDSDNHRVVIMSLDGDVLKTFGRSGQGPGEFEGAIAVDVDPQGRVYVFDGVRRRYTVFSPEGEFEADALLPNGMVAIIRARIHPSGSMIVTTMQMDENFQQTYMLSILSADLAESHVLAKVPLPPTDWAAMGQPGFFETYLVDQFEALADGLPMGAVCHSKIVAVTSNVYAGEIYDHHGHLETSFTKEYKPVRYSDEVKEAACEAIWEGISANAPFGSQITYPIYQKALARAEFPKFIPPISDVFALGDGFGVLSSFDTIKEEGRLDVFDCQGACVASGTYRGIYGVMRCRGNRLFVLGIGEDDEMELHVYRIDGIK